MQQIFLTHGSLTYPKGVDLKIESSRLILRPLGQQDLQPHYLSWLNDKEVQHYSRRRGRHFEMEDLKKFLDALPQSTDLHLAVIRKSDLRHIGNISLNNRDDLNRSAEISIMMGDRETWGQGYGGEAVQALSVYGFQSLKLHRLWAESPNPAFNQLMKRLGWNHEGTKRDAFWLDDQFVPLELWARFSHE
jgi:RimJ/RimL family protein N-acetyltransferase